jgi:hypothetical protein
VIEAAVESYFKKRVKETGGEERKVVWPGRKGAPDRFAGWARSQRTAFVELKRPKGKAAAHQEREHARLRLLGVRVEVIDTREGVDRFVEEMSVL